MATVGNTSRSVRLERFFSEYLVDRNGAQAAIRAGYSPRTARTIAAQILRKPKNRERLDKMLEMATQMQVAAAVYSIDDVVRESYRLAMLDPRKAFKADGTLHKMKEMPDEVAAAISSIKVVDSGAIKGTVLQVKFWDKNSAAERLFKHLGLYQKDNEQRGDALKKFLELVQNGDAGNSRITPKRK